MVYHSFPCFFFFLKRQYLIIRTDTRTVIVKTTGKNYRKSVESCNTTKLFVVC